MNKREIGSKKEEIAVEYLKNHGVTILEKNFRNSRGEIDIIGRHENYLVFFEVKFRSSTNTGRAIEAVNFKKQQQICKVADYYRKIHNMGLNTSIRYDVVAIQGEDIEWVKNAFYHVTSRF